MSAVTELAAAIRDTLTPPEPPMDDTAGWRLYDRLIVSRACHVRGVLKSLAEGNDSGPSVAAAVHVIAQAAELIPVNYPVREEQSGGGS